MRAQRQFPVLPDQFAAKTVMWLLAHQMKTGGLVNPPRGDQHVVCPQGELAIARSAGKADTLPDKAASNAEPASRRLDEEQSQFGDFFAVPDEEYRADNSAVTLGDPAALAPSIEIIKEVGGDASDKRLEAHVQTIFLGVEQRHGGG